MSFSKARIQRFNELPNEAPPPGAYDPKFDSKVKGSAFEKKNGRFNDAKSTSSNECSASISSRSTSNASVKKFKLPNVPKKKVMVKSTVSGCSRSTAKSINNETKKQTEASYEPQQELADLKVECDNKNKTIYEYEKQMEEMKFEIKELSDKYIKLEEKYSTREEQHKYEIESMLPCVLLGQEIEIGVENDNDATITAEIASLEDELNSYKEQVELVDKMLKLEAATNEFDKMTEKFDEALNLKDLQMTDLLKLQSETECKLNNVKTELQKSEKHVDDLQTDFKIVNQLNNVQDVIINKNILDSMTSILQDYFDFENYGKKCNIENETFPIEIKQFLNKIKQYSTDLKIHFEREIELSRDKFNEERENLEQELDSKRILVSDLENKLTESNETNLFLTEELRDIQKSYKDMSQSLLNMKAELEDANEKYKEAVKSHKMEMELNTNIHLEEKSKLNSLLEETRNNYLKELDNITNARNKELLEIRQTMEKRIEDEKLRMKDSTNKIVENAEAITRETLSACRAESEERIRRVIANTEAKVELLKKNSEDELRIANEKYNERLEKIENEKITLSNDLIKRDLEIVQLNAALEEMKCTVQTQESFSQSLQDDLDRMEAELGEKRVELRNLKDQIRNESSEMVARKRRLELVMSENQASVAALSSRLAQSEAEVDRLQSDLELKESSLMECQNLLDSITHKSKMLQEKLESITGCNDDKIQFINQIEMKCVKDINDAKISLNDKIEILKSVTINELKKAQEECVIKTECNAELKANLQQMSERLTEVTNMLLKMEEIHDEKSIEVSKLQLKTEKLQQQLNEKDKIIEKNKFEFDKQIQQYKTDIEEKQEQITKLKTEFIKLEKQKCELEDQKYNFIELELKHKDQVDVLKSNLENEKTQREKLEQHINQFEKTVELLTNECKQFAGKYSESKTGQNNNHKQKKQVFQLKEKISVQQMDLLRLRQELDTKNDMIDELRQERKQFGKENLHSVISSPHKSLFSKNSANTTPISSPHKPHTPLRDRNE